mgnify:CR=1 FL=1
MKISIVIRSYNEAKHIGKLMSGISAQTLPPHEVIVVDSGSSDETARTSIRRAAAGSPSWCVRSPTRV